VLHFAPLVIEGVVNLFEAVWAVLDIDAVRLWSADMRLGDLKIVPTIAELGKRFTDECFEKWTLDAIRWVAGCRDVKIGDRSIVIVRALQGQSRHPSCR
jgi:hypothetical protein